MTAGHPTKLLFINILHYNFDLIAIGTARAMSNVLRK